MQDYRDYVKDVTAIHKEAVQRLVDCNDTNLLELAEMFEGIANLYLDISEEMRSRFISLKAPVDTRLARRVPAPPSAIMCREEAPEG